jgi:hypothetical protein
MSILNRLLKKYPIEFIYNISLPKKINSLAQIEAKNFSSKLERKYKIYCGEIKIGNQEEEEYNIMEENVGEEYKKKRKKSIRKFLTDE